MAGDDVVAGDCGRIAERLDGDFAGAPCLGAAGVFALEVGEDRSGQGDQIGALVHHVAGGGFLLPVDGDVGGTRRGFVAERTAGHPILAGVFAFFGDLLAGGRGRSVVGHVVDVAEPAARRTDTHSGAAQYPPFVGAQVRTRQLG